MKSTVFVVGGSRSGKSDYAQSRAEELSTNCYFIATCPVNTDDGEMAQRISAHQQKRNNGHWQTKEESLDLASAVTDLPADSIILIDCLTLWVSNLMLAVGDVTDELIGQRAEELLVACRNRQGSVILVSGEVGCATVPEHPLSRTFRDLVGCVNQVVASLADEVVLVTCGIPQKIKG